MMPSMFDASLSPRGFGLGIAPALFSSAFALVGCGPRASVPSPATVTSTDPSSMVDTEPVRYPGPCRVTVREPERTYAIAFTYLPDGVRIQREDQDDHVDRYVCNEIGQVALHQNRWETELFTYDDAGFLTQRQLRQDYGDEEGGRTLTENFTRNDTRVTDTESTRTLTVQQDDGSGEAPVSMRHVFHYEGSGDTRRPVRREFFTEDYQSDERYTYDDDGRLSEVRRSREDALFRHYRYGYDADGNRVRVELERSARTHIMTAQYDAAGNYRAMTGARSDNPHDVATVDFDYSCFEGGVPATTCDAFAIAELFERFRSPYDASCRLNCWP